MLKLNILAANAEFDKDQSQELVKEIAKDIEDAKRLPQTEKIEPRVAIPPPAAPATTTPGETSYRSPVLASGPLYLEMEQSIRNDPKLMMLANDQAKIDMLIHYQARVQAELAFERVYRAIFGSQLQALRLADRPGGIPLSDVVDIYTAAKTSFPAAHNDRSFERWAEFLFETGLLLPPGPQTTGSMVQTSEFGHEFNVYVTTLRLTDPFG
jgi:hypothetical protein